MKRGVCVFTLLLLLAFRLVAQNLAGASLLEQAIGNLRDNENEKAAESFRLLLNDSAFDSFHADAMYWLLKTEILLGNYEPANQYVDQFLLEYSGDVRIPEVFYHRARLLFFQGEPEDAIVALNAFIKNFPSSEFVSSAYYWMGVAFISLGKLEEADALFQDILSKYPHSVKREAAAYKRSEIEFLYREQELLNLLQLSHEKQLKDAEQFYRRETEYRNVSEEYEKLENDTELDTEGLYLKDLLGAKKRLLEIRQYYVEELLGIYNDG